MESAVDTAGDTAATVLMLRRFAGTVKIIADVPTLGLLALPLIAMGYHCFRQPTSLGTIVGWPRYLVTLRLWNFFFHLIMSTDS